jgi:hypothetical protein
MKIYYKSKEEALYSTNYTYSPHYEGERLVYHSFIVRIDIEYKNNPIDKITGQSTKRTLGTPIIEKYPASTTSEEEAEGYIMRAIERQIGSSKLVSEKQAEKIIQEWNETQ